MRGKEAVRRAFAEGFYTEVALFPVYVSGSLPGTVEERNSGQRKAAGSGRKARPEEMPEEYRAASDAPGILPESDWRKKKGLEKLFSPGFLLKDENQDGLADRLDAVIGIPENPDSPTLAAACNLAFRLGMETTAYSGTLVRYIEEVKRNLEPENIIYFEDAPQCGIFYEEDGDSKRVKIAGRGRELETFVSNLCGGFPMQPRGREWESVLRELTDTFCARNEDGELLAAVIAAEGKKKADAYVSPWLAQKWEETEDRECGSEEHGSGEYGSGWKGSLTDVIRFHNYKSGKKIYEKSYPLSWEKEVLEGLLDEKLYPLLHEGDELILEAALSEDEDVRRELEKAVCTQAEEKGARIGKCRVLCAYKQGYSWIREEVLPVLEEKKAVRVETAFRPFLPEGAEEKDEENGALPSYNNVGAGNPDAWYDLPIRFLQELYPIKDEIVRRLGTDSGNVLFRRLEKEEAGAADQRPEGAEAEPTYLCTAWDAAGKEVFRGTYRAAYSERPYLDAFPDMGKVHPSTGYVRAFINGKCVLDERICTDLEQIWDVYQRSVLPDCMNYIESRHPGGVHPADQPVFSSLVLEVEASEPDEKLDSREDLISSLDALHEDLYFVGSDYFKNYGLRKSGEILDAPGLILPVIRKKKGRPQFRVVLYDREKDGFCVETEDGVWKPTRRREETELFMESLTVENGQNVVTLRTNVPPDCAEKLAELIRGGMNETCAALSGVDILRLRTASDFSVEVPVVPWCEPEKNLSITEIDLMENQVIGYRDYLKIISRLKHVPGISVFRAGVSYEGREIYAIELLPRDKGYVSRTKRLTSHPSLIINARHHANEVSSTNAAFLLLRKILTEDQYRDLPDLLDLILIPEENVDGAALHYKLQKENPYWKLHVARFNAVGKEFYNEYFHEDTIHTEAYGFTRLWQRALPDIVVDNHGVPTHEWEQQFSGYTSPSYKGFWLPRSLLYGYFWYVSDPEYRSSYAVNKAMEDIIADAVGEVPEMARWNREWAEQFETYAHGWMPGLFPADYYKEMINYWIPFQSDPGHRYPSIRFPWITTVAYTSEVADETAQGEYLNLCAGTHVVHDEATIRMLTEKCICVVDEKFSEDGENMELKMIRRRPVVIDK